MRKGTVHLKTGGMLLAMVMVFLFAAGAVKVDTSLEGPVKSGAGLIMIDTMKAMGPLERPPVPYFHSRHTESPGQDQPGLQCLPHGRRKRAPVAQVQAVGRYGPADGDRHLPCQLHRLPPRTGRAGPEKRATNLRGVSPGKSRGCLHLEGSRLRQIPALPPCQRPMRKNAKAATTNTTSRPSNWSMSREKRAPVSIAIRTRARTTSWPARRHRTTNASAATGTTWPRTNEAGPISCVGCHDADYQVGIEVVEGCAPAETQPAGCRPGENR
jgi:hypothetical protein